MLFAQPVRQATKAAARAELCYISLASPALSLWPTSTHISSLHKHVAAQNLGKSQNSVRLWPEQPARCYRKFDRSKILSLSGLLTLNAQSILPHAGNK